MTSSDRSERHGWLLVGFFVVADAVVVRARLRLVSGDGRRTHQAAVPGRVGIASVVPGALLLDLALRPCARLVRTLS